MTRTIIVAIADNHAIGRNNELLWHISEDLKFFKKQTLGCPVIMGRKTFESIGRPLPKRLNIVVSRGSFARTEGVMVVDSLEKAFELAAGQDSEKCFVIGGGQIYAAAMDLVDEMIITHVHTAIEDADTFFPDFDKSKWTIVSRSEVYKDLESGLEYEFVVYKR